MLVSFLLLDLFHQVAIFRFLIHNVAKLCLAVELNQHVTSMHAAAAGHHFGNDESAQALSREPWRSDRVRLNRLDDAMKSERRHKVLFLDDCGACQLAGGTIRLIRTKPADGY